LSKNMSVANEWQVDSNGQKYRMNGFIREYEMKVRIDGIDIPESQVEDYNRRKQAAQKKRFERQRVEHNRHCPFRDGVNTDCVQDKCALYQDGCMLGELADELPRKETEGRQCPFNKYHSNCRKDCALFNEIGCTLTAIKIRK